jgi:protocatechuate 4,5-dioxygenase beta chain
MAHIIGGVACSHIPSIGSAIAKGLQEDPYWKPFFDGFPPVRDWLQTAQADVAVVFYNDHGLNFFLDKMPTFAVGAAATYSNADEGWGIPVTDPLNGNQELSWHLIDRLIQDEFDIVSCQEMLVDHAFTIPLKLLWPDKCPVTVVPICINTVQFPLPSAKRVFALGQAVGRAIRGWDASKNVVILGTGGLSHQLDGARAGFINKKFDLEFMDSLLNEPQWATRFSMEELVEQSGTQGVELLMWLAMRGALGDAKEFKIHKVHENYHIPISNTATGLIAFECA